MILLKCRLKVGICYYQWQTYFLSNFFGIFITFFSCSINTIVVVAAIESSHIVDTQMSQIVLRIAGMLLL